MPPHFAAEAVSYWSQLNHEYTGVCAAYMDLTPPPPVRHTQRPNGRQPGHLTCRTAGVIISPAEAFWLSCDVTDLTAGARKHHSAAAATTTKPAPSPSPSSQVSEKKLLLGGTRALGPVSLQTRCRESNRSNSTATRATRARAGTSARRYCPRCCPSHARLGLRGEVLGSAHCDGTGGRPVQVDCASSRPGIRPGKDWQPVNRALVLSK